MLRLYLGARSNLHRQFVVPGDPNQDIKIAMEELGRYVLNAVHVHGIPNILEAYVSSVDVNETDPVTGCIVSRKTPVIFTRGSNMRRVLSLPWVDDRRTYTTDLKEIETELGIEACYHAICRFLHKSVRSVYLHVPQIAILAQGSLFCVFVFACVVF